MNLLKNKMGMRVLTLALCAVLGGSVLAVKAESVAGETVVQEAVQDENMSESREIDHPAQEEAEPDGQAETGETTGREREKFFDGESIDGELPDGAKELTDGELPDGAGEREITAYYKIESVEPFDMFPQTKHVETLVCLSKKSEKHISIDVEFGESDGQISLKKLQEELNEQKHKKR